MNRIGAHVSVAGGLHLGFEHGRRLRCDCIQIFVKNQRQWSGKPLDAQQIRLFREAQTACGIGPVIAHASYLINLAASDASIREKGIAATIDELTRCEALGIPFLVVHPGAHMGDGAAKGIKRAAGSINTILKHTARFSARLALENTAGQGSALGVRLAELGDIVATSSHPQRLAVCIDTCHLFAAGYDFRDPAGCERVLMEISDCVGLDRVAVLHVNDSLGACGSRLDRHAHIGKGLIGTKGFRCLLSDPRIAGAPRILETPHDVDENGREWLKRDLAALRRLHQH